MTYRSFGKLGLAHAAAHADLVSLPRPAERLRQCPVRAELLVRGETGGSSSPKTCDELPCDEVLLLVRPNSPDVTRGRRGDLAIGVGWLYLASRKDPRRRTSSAEGQSSSVTAERRGIIVLRRSST